MPYKFEGFQIGQRIRAYDFPNYIPNSKGMYVEGQIIEVSVGGTEVFPFAHYLIKTEVDTLYETVGPHGREWVAVPMESSMDWDERVSLVEDKADA